MVSIYLFVNIIIFDGHEYRVFILCILSKKVLLINLAKRKLSLMIFEMNY